MWDEWIIIGLFIVLLFTALHLTAKAWAHVLLWRGQKMASREHFIHEWLGDKIILLLEGERLQPKHKRQLDDREVRYIYNKIIAAFPFSGLSLTHPEVIKANIRERLGTHKRTEGFQKFLDKVNNLNKKQRPVRTMLKRQPKPAM